MWFSKRVFLAGSGQYGMRISHWLDCNVYLLNGGNEYALIDAGCGLEPERIVANIEVAGLRISQIRYVLLTHAHADHAAGAAFWKKHYGLQVLCPAEAAPWVSTGDEEFTSLRLARKAGAYPDEYVYPSCAVDRTVSEGDTIRVGDIELEVIETPGHAHGHVSYVLRDNEQLAVFTGDVIFAGGTVVMQNTWDCSIQEYAATTARLHEMHIDQLYPGHKNVLLANAHLDIERAHKIFEGLGVPPNFI